MSSNRMAGFFAQQDNSPEWNSVEGLGGFALNPFIPQAAPWQLQIYQAAFLQAQKEVEESEDAWPLAEWWN